MEVYIADAVRTPRGAARCQSKGGLLCGMWCLHPPSPSSPLPVILDVDTGIDDAHALLVALRSPECEVVGVSCMCGNTAVDTVVGATLRVVDAAEAGAGVFEGVQSERGVEPRLVIPVEWVAPSVFTFPLGSSSPFLGFALRTPPPLREALLVGACGSARRPLLWRPTRCCLQKVRMLAREPYIHHIM